MESSHYAKDCWSEKDMSYFNEDAVEVRVSVSNRIRDDTGAGKTIWPQSATCGKRIPGDVDLTFRTITGKLVKSGKRSYVASCDDWRVNHLSSRCPSVRVQTTAVFWRAHDDEWSCSYRW